MDFHILNHPCIPGDKAYLIMMDNCVDVFLDSVCKNFLEYFSSDIHKGNWSEVLFLCWVSVWFGYECNCNFIELGSFPPVSIFWNSLKSISIRSSLKV